MTTILHFLKGLSGGGKTVDGLNNINNRNNVETKIKTKSQDFILLCHLQFDTQSTRKGKFSSEETAKNLKKRLSSASEETSELLGEAFDNPESTPIHQQRTPILENDEKSEIIRKVIGELDSKDSTMLSNPYTLSKDRRETRC